MEIINNTIAKIKKYNYKPHIILLAICVLISIMVMKTSLIKTHDGFIHLERIIGTYNEIKNYKDIPIIIKDFAGRMGLWTQYFL